MHCVTWPDQISGLENGSCVTIGNFDGVHIGHQRLIARVRDLAAGFGLPSVVITFEPHPLRFSRARRPRLSLPSMNNAPNSSVPWA